MFLRYGLKLSDVQLLSSCWGYIYHLARFTVEHSLSPRKGRRRIACLPRAKRRDVIDRPKFRVSNTTTDTPSTTEASSPYLPYSAISPSFHTFETLISQPPVSSISTSPPRHYFIQICPLTLPPSPPLTIQQTASPQSVSLAPLPQQLFPTPCPRPSNPSCPLLHPVSALTTAP